jgi:glycosyltransferase involved in cell wall biosynthesis
MRHTSAEPLVSVVTPFYNTADYLAECIESVLAQSYGNFEFILQDNASMDGSTDIAARFARIDERIRLVRREELLPQVSNYNAALTQIHRESKYCKIVQADDWIDPECIQRMVRLAERSDRVGLVSSYCLEGTAVRCTGLEHRETLLDGRELARRHLLSSFFLFGTPTTVMYRSDIVRARRPFFREGRYHEDTEACYEILRDWDFGFVHQILSFSRVREDSIYSTMKAFDSPILDKLICLRMYGPQFLQEQEMSSEWRRYTSNYYDRLARGALQLRGNDYWKFHRDGLGTAGLRLDPARLGLAVFRALLSRLMCPRELLAGLRRT